VSRAPRVLVVAEYYPRANDPVLGVWAHRQARAARQAGADVRVLVLHRPIPPVSALRAMRLRHAWSVVSQPARAVIDDVAVDYVRYLSPPRALSYSAWGAWAAPALRRALTRIRREFAFELIHAHYAVPGGDAVRRVAPEVPLVISVHGHDVQGRGAGSPAVRRALGHARLVLANSAGTAARCAALGATATRVVHLGAEMPAEPDPRPSVPTLVTVAHLAARKRHADVIAALPALAARHPGLRYVIVGDGPERERLQSLAASLGVAARVEFRGALAPDRAAATARAATLFVLPSVDEAFGVAYVEAMAGGVPAIGCAGEDGPSEIAAAGGGMVLVRPRDPASLGAEIDALLRDGPRLEALSASARETVARSFTWERCGVETVQAYGAVIAAARRSGSLNSQS
jgi:teichuronic acid biosynthesis glycosyltransferase TuaC